MRRVRVCACAIFHTHWLSSSQALPKLTIKISQWAARNAHQDNNTSSPFSGPLSRSTLVSRYQQKIRLLTHFLFMGIVYIMSVAV